MILAGNGSDELLAMLFRATLGPGNTVAYPVPTYSLYDTLASIQEARVLGFPVEDDFSIPPRGVGHGARQPHDRLQSQFAFGNTDADCEAR